MTDAHLGPVAFASLGLHPKVMDGIRQAGFTQCTPIQAQTLPIALAGRDVAGQAQTGTGKTAAFLVALYQEIGRASCRARVESWAVGVGWKKRGDREEK